MIAAIGAFYNGHLLILQIYGWGSMFNDYFSTTQSLEKAVEMTFDGDNACDICNNVIGALDQKDGNTSDDYVVLEYKPVILGLAVKFTFAFQKVYHSFIGYPNDTIAKRLELPTLPPPRVF